MRQVTTPQDIINIIIFSIFKNFSGTFLFLIRNIIEIITFLGEKHRYATKNKFIDTYIAG